MSTNSGTRRSLLVSSGWIQAGAVVVLFGFFVMGLLAYKTYTSEPPIPRRVIAANGALLFTGADITHGQEVFLKNGLMEYGSIFGHGAYLGPDYTADYLNRAAQIVEQVYGGEAEEGRAHRLTVDDFKTNRFDASAQTLTFSAAQASAFQQLEAYYSQSFSDPSSANGLRPRAITAPADLHDLTAFFAWTAWAAAANRPHEVYSYTNNWPPEPLVDNAPTANTLVWSVLSLIALLGGIGLLFGAFGRWSFLGWHGREERTIAFRPPDEVHLTPAQRATAWFFFVMAALFLLQALLGGATQHYRADLTSFFGIDLGRWLPYNIVRTWHVQLAIFWVAVSFLAAGIFLAPMIAGREPRRQHWLAYGLLGALVVVVVGSLAGEYAGIMGWMGNWWKWFGDQGFEYLDLGRFWQVLLSLGLLAWVLILWRGMKDRLANDHMGNMPWLFFFSALSLPAFYAVGLIAQPSSNFTTADFWRFWVVHLWVEDFLELFTTIMVAYVFVLLGVVREKVALQVIYLDLVLYSVGGVIGTMHHLYFSGEPAEHMALGAFFSAAEVIPLTFLTLEAWSFLQLGARQEGPSRKPFPHLWAVMFLVSVGFWNFLGAGVFGFLVNLPIVSYYEIGTGLTANHAHAAMMGVYGMLAVGLALFCIRYMIPERRWSDKAAKISFWSLNLGLAWMVFATLFPLGISQLYESVEVGYVAARSLKFLGSPINKTLEWMRLPGDVVFIVGGVLPLLYLCILAVRRLRPAGDGDATGEVLFTEERVAIEKPASELRG
ncbi:MAG TPA: cbb3-type cytochrome c oxidase subunit I [Terriglobales bacterium]|nr:cbb3-type cytochrome c oxidase subunit I [Terriglobales bacterium]